MSLEKIHKRRKNKGISENLSGFAMGSIPVIGFVLFGMIPLLLAIAMAFMYVPGKGDLNRQYVLAIYSQYFKDGNFFAYLYCNSSCRCVFANKGY